MSGGFRVEVVEDKSTNLHIIHLHINDMSFEILRGKNPGVLSRMAEELRVNIRHAVATERTKL